MSPETDCKDILSLPEFEERARRCMTPMAYEYVASGGPTGERRKALGDVLWALLNSAEFALNH